MVQPDSGDLCVVCQHAIEADEAESTTVCGHRFHFDCLLRSLSVSRNCPVCRGNVVPGDLVSNSTSCATSASAPDSDNEIDIEITASEIGQSAFDTLVSTLECMEEGAAQAIVAPRPLPPTPRPLPPTPTSLAPTPSNVMHHVSNGEIQAVREMIAFDRRLCFTASDAGDSLLHIAVMSRNEDMVRFLATNADIHINSTNNAFMTPLHYCVFSANTPMLMLVLNLGGFIDAADASGKTALMYAAINKCTEILGLLLDRHANHHAFDCIGETVLHHAARAKCVDSVRMLARQRLINPNFMNVVGETALHVACGSGSRASVRYLLVAGALSSKRTKAGKLPADYVASDRNGRNSILSLLGDN